MRNTGTSKYIIYLHVWPYVCIQHALVHTYKQVKYRHVCLLKSPDKRLAERDSVVTLGQTPSKPGAVKRLPDKSRCWIAACRSVPAGMILSLSPDSLRVIKVSMPA